MRSRTILFMVLLCAAPSCSRRQMSLRAVPDETLVPIYADVLIASEEETLRGIKHDRPAAFDSLCRAYALSASDYDTAIERYKADLPAWKQFHEKVAKRLELLQQQMAAKRLQR